MITVFETNEELDRFEVFTDLSGDLTIRSIVDFDTDVYRAFVFSLQQEEAINLANYILKLYSE